MAADAGLELDMDDMAELTQFANLDAFDIGALEDDEDEVWKFRSLAPRPGQPLPPNKHPPLPAFTAPAPPETLNDAIGLLVAQGTENAARYEQHAKQMLKTLMGLEEKARILLKKRRAIRTRTQELEDMRGGADCRRSLEANYSGLFDIEPEPSKYDLRYLTKPQRIASVLASDAELSEVEAAPMSRKSSSFAVLNLENQMAAINSQLKMLQSNLNHTEKGLEKTHLATRHAIVSLIKLFRTPTDHNLSQHLELSQKDTLPHLSGLIVMLLKQTRPNYVIEGQALGPRYSSATMSKNDAEGNPQLHTYVQIRNDTFMADYGCGDVIHEMAGHCLLLGAKRGLVFTSEKREVFTPDDSALIAGFKDKGIHIIIVFVEDLLDELPSEASAVTALLGGLADEIAVFTG